MTLNSFFGTIGVGLVIALSGVCYWQKTTIDDLTTENNLLEANLIVQKTNIENLKSKIEEQNSLVDQYKKDVSQFEKEIQELNEKMSVVYPENEKMEENRSCTEQIQWLRERSSQL